MLLARTLIVAVGLVVTVLIAAPPGASAINPAAFALRAAASNGSPTASHTLPRDVAG